jgi:hypothetical protein
VLLASRTHLLAMVRIRTEACVLSLCVFIPSVDVLVKATEGRLSRAPRPAIPTPRRSNQELLLGPTKCLRL